MFRILHIETGYFVYKMPNGNLFIPPKAQQQLYPISEYKTRGRANAVFVKNRMMDIFTCEDINSSFLSLDYKYTIKLNKETKLLFDIIEV